MSAIVPSNKIFDVSLIEGAHICHRLANVGPSSPLLSARQAYGSLSGSLPTGSRLRSAYDRSGTP
jgi:hypothetical protein